MTTSTLIGMTFVLKERDEEKVVDKWHSFLELKTNFQKENY